MAKVDFAGPHPRLQLGGTTVDVPRVALALAWDGDYAVLWRAPDAPATPLRAGPPKARTARTSP